MKIKVCKHYKSKDADSAVGMIEPGEPGMIRTRRAVSLRCLGQ